MGKVKHVLLTGGNGFLGSFVLQKLLDEDFYPILLIRADSDLWRIAPLLERCKVYTIGQSSTNYKDIFRLHPIDVIIHAATSYGRNISFSDTLKTNVIFPLELIEEGVKNNVKLFINTDSFFGKPGFDQSYLKNYTDSKRILEDVLKNFGGGIKIANLRMEHIFGENDSEDKFITLIIKKMVNDEPEIALTDGIQKRDFIYAKDAANAYIVIIRNLMNLGNYQEFQVGTGKSITVKALITKIARILNANSKLKFGILARRDGDIDDSFADIKSLTDIGWHPQYELDKALQLTLNVEKERLGL